MASDSLVRSRQRACFTDSGRMPIELAICFESMPVATYIAILMSCSVIESFSSRSLRAKPDVPVQTCPRSSHAETAVCCAILSHSLFGVSLHPEPPFVGHITDFLAHAADELLRFVHRYLGGYKLLRHAVTLP